MLKVERIEGGKEEDSYQVGILIDIPGYIVEAIRHGNQFHEYYKVRQDIFAALRRIIIRHAGLDSRHESQVNVLFFDHNLMDALRDNVVEKGDTK